MNIIYFMIGTSILIAIVFFAAFLWAMHSGQNDDLHTPAMRILFDPTLEPPSRADANVSKNK